jgi:hypothetical protein
MTSGGTHAPPAETRRGRGHTGQIPCVPNIHAPRHITHPCIEEGERAAAWLPYALAALLREPDSTEVSHHSAEPIMCPHIVILTSQKENWLGLELGLAAHMAARALYEG